MTKKQSKVLNELWRAIGNATECSLWDELQAGYIRSTNSINDVVDAVNEARKQNRHGSHRLTAE